MHKVAPQYRRVYASTGSVICSIESRFRGQKSTHWRNNLAVLISTALVYQERRLIEPGLTGARLNALAQPALVYKNTVLVYTEWVTVFITLTGARLNALAQPALVYKKYGSCLYGMGYLFVSQLTNVNRFSKGETTETATELACFMVSD